MKYDFWDESTGRFNTIDLPVLTVIAVVAGVGIFMKVVFSWLHPWYWLEATSWLVYAIISGISLLWYTWKLVVAGLVIYFAYHLYIGPWLDKGLLAEEQRQEASRAAQVKASPAKKVHSRRAVTPPKTAVPSPAAEATETGNPDEAPRPQ